MPTSANFWRPWRRRSTSFPVIATTARRCAFSDHAYLPQTGEFLHYTIEDYLVRIVALDSIVPGQRKGAFCGRRLAWLERVLEQAPRKPTLLLIHQPPFDIGTVADG